MGIREIFEVSDVLFAENRCEEAAIYLEKSLVQAKEAKEWQTELSILNELMGYYRSISKFDEAWKYAFRAMEITEEQKIGSTADGVTTYLNVANIYRATGKAEEAMEIYRRVEAVYKEQHVEKDFRLGGLYNNMSVASLELGRRDDAVEYGKAAIENLEAVPGTEDERATVYANLAGAMLNAKAPDLEKADEYMDGAMKLFAECENSAHYCAALAMKAYITYLKKDFEQALVLYKKAMEETKKHYGENQDYKRLAGNYEGIKKMMNGERE